MSWVWFGWLLAVAVTFAVLEGYALKSNRTTLSRLIWNTSRAFPPLPWFVGVGIGFLAAHFWWVGPGCDLVQ